MGRSPHTDRMAQRQREKEARRLRDVRQALRTPGATELPPPDTVEQMQPLTKWRVAKAVFTGLRAKQKFEKGRIDMSKPLSKPTLESKTTQDVAIGGAVSGGTIFAILAGARGLWGDSIPWGQEHDMVISLAATALLTPVLSRLKAWFRRGSTH